MKQDAIWDYWQNEATEVFRNSAARQAFLAKKVRPKKKVLNIGVGGGIFEKLAIEMGLDVHSLDPSERSIASLRQQLDLGEKAMVGYGQDIPFADRSFEAVVISETIEHLSEDVTEQTLTEIWRVLVPGGRIIGTVPSREDLSEQVVVCPDCGKRFHRWGHSQSFDPGRIRALLSRTFEVEEIFERPFTTWSAVDWRGKAYGAVTLLLSRLGAHTSNQVIVFMARKPHV